MCKCFCLDPPPDADNQNAAALALFISYGRSHIEHFKFKTMLGLNGETGVHVLGQAFAILNLMRREQGNVAMELGFRLYLAFVGRSTQEIRHRVMQSVTQVYNFTM